jgi:hypothetical protein
MEPVHAMVTLNKDDQKPVEFFSKPFTEVKYGDGFVTNKENGIYTFQYRYSGVEIFVIRTFVRQPVSFYDDRSTLVRNGFIDIDEDYNNPNARLYGLDGGKRDYVGKLILGWQANG